LKNFDIKYGKKRVTLKLDEAKVLGELAAQKLQPLIDAKGKIKQVLKYPILSRSIYETVQSGESVAIIVSDRTRNIAASVFLPILIDSLNSLGVPDKDITIYFACGTHRLHTKKEHVDIVGDEIAKRVKLSDHDCSDKKNLVKIGTTMRGTPVIVNKAVVESDRIILTGAITYHYFAGYGGGRKAVLPGISAFKTIQDNHKLIFSGGNSSTGILAGNPVHEDMVEAAKMVEPDMILNVIMDDAGRIAAVFAGDLVGAHEAGCEALDSYYKVSIQKKAKLVIASAGGGSKDMNFVQAHKAMEMASYALEDGGTMILVAQAKEGLPSKIYNKYIELGSSEAVRAELNREFTIPGHTVYSAIKKSEKFNIIWVTDMDEKILTQMKIKKAVNLAVAMNMLEGIDDCYVMPDAYNTFPVVSC
jgi:lactate racemase